MSYEIKISIENESQEQYKDDLIIALVNCGYAVWLDIDGAVTYIAPETEVKLLKEKPEVFR